jgi:hypothetical protein
MPLQTRTDTTGFIVGWLPAAPTVQHRVSIRAIARQLEREGRLPHLTPYELDMLARMDDPMVAGKIGKKIKKGLKKAGAAIKKVAKSKILKGIVSTLGKIVPPPLNLPIKAAQGAAKLATAVAKGVKGAKTVKKAAAKVAAGKMPIKKLQAVAKKAGVNPKVAVDAAVIQKTANNAAAGDPKAKAAMAMAADITSKKPSAKLLAAARAAPAGGRTVSAKGPSGKTYRFSVQA